MKINTVRAIRAVPTSTVPGFLFLLQLERAVDPAALGRKVPVSFSQMN